MTLFKATKLTIAIWTILTSSIVYAIYVFLMSGGELNTKDITNIAIAIGAAAATLSAFYGTVALIEKKRNSILHETYRTWGPAAGIKVYNAKSEHFEQSVARAVRATWTGRNSTIHEITIDGQTSMKAEHLRTFLNFLNNKAPKNGAYALNLSEVTSGDISATLTDKNSPLIHEVEATLTILEILENYFPDNSAHGIEFDGELAGNPTHFLVTNMPHEINVRQYKEIEAKLQESIPAKESSAWSILPISTTVVKIHQTKQSDQRNSVTTINLLGKASTAALQFIGSYAIVNDVEIFAISNGTPLEFDVLFRNENDLQDTETITKFVRSLINILEGKFGGSWKATNDITNGRIGMTKVA